LFLASLKDHADVVLLLRIKQAANIGRAGRVFAAVCSIKQPRNTETLAMQAT
jgi:hypothetical protein